MLVMSYTDLHHALQPRERIHKQFWQLMSVVLPQLLEYMFIIDFQDVFEVSNIQFLEGGVQISLFYFAKRIKANRFLSF